MTRKRRHPEARPEDSPQLRSGLRQGSGLTHSVRRTPHIGGLASTAGNCPPDLEFSFARQRNARGA